MIGTTIAVCDQCKLLDECIADVLTCRYICLNCHEFNTTKDVNKWRLRMFNLFKKKKHKTTCIMTTDTVKQAVASLNDYKKKFSEFEAAMKPLRDEQSKAKFIIKQIYTQHNIDTGKSWELYDYCLDNEAFTDLCVFSDVELASLRKWTQRYKELETEIMNLIEKYHGVNVTKESV